MHLSLWASCFFFILSQTKAFFHKESTITGFPGLYILSEISQYFCMFCTGKQVSISHFTQFCILTKINVAIGLPFMYNVFIRASCPHGELKLTRKE